MKTRRELMKNKFGEKKDIISRCRSFTTSFVFWVINLECASWRTTPKSRSIGTTTQGSMNNFDREFIQNSFNGMVTRARKCIAVGE